MRIFPRLIAVMVWLCAMAVAQTSNIDRLIDDLENPNIVKRSQAAAEIWHSSSDNPERFLPAVPALCHAVVDRDLNVRYMAIQSIKNIGPEAREAIPSLIAALDTYPEPPRGLYGPLRYYADVRWSAAVALGAMGKDAKQAVPALKKMLQDPSEEVRKAVAAALKEIEKK